MCTSMLNNTGILATAQPVTPRADAQPCSEDSGYPDLSRVCDEYRRAAFNTHVPYIGLPYFIGIGRAWQVELTHHKSLLAKNMAV